MKRMAVVAMLIAAVVLVVVMVWAWLFSSPAPLVFPPVQSTFNPSSLPQIPPLGG